MVVPRRLVSEMRRMFSGADELGRFLDAAGRNVSFRNCELLWKGEWSSVPVSDLEAFLWAFGYYFEVKRVHVD